MRANARLPIADLPPDTARAPRQVMAAAEGYQGLGRSGAATRKSIRRRPSPLFRWPRLDLGDNRLSSFKINLAQRRHRRLPVLFRGLAGVG
jgi:hypothetical protein